MDTLRGASVNIVKATVGAPIYICSDAAEDQEY